MNRRTREAALEVIYDISNGDDAVRQNLEGYLGVYPNNPNCLDSWLERNGHVSYDTEAGRHAFRAGLVLGIVAALEEPIETLK